MNTAPTYTVFNPADSDTVYGRGLTAEEAMHEILTHDGRGYEIRRDNRGIFYLYGRDAHNWRTRKRTTVFSLKTSRAAVTADIAQQVIAACWPRHPEAMTDEDYDTMRAEANQVKP